MIVIELGKLKTLPDGSTDRECSVCGLYKEFLSFCNDQGKLSRTNCKSCYEAPRSEWVQLQAYNNKMKQSPSQEVLDYKQNQVVLENSISKEELIKALNGLPDGSRVVVTQSGYYSEGVFASIFTPVKEDNLGLNVFSIGHSSQNS